MCDEIPIAINPDVIFDHVIERRRGVCLMICGRARTVRFFP
jgi:hypothetical protein